MNITVQKLKKLASTLNNEDRIVGVWKMKKDELMSALKAKNYKPHYNEKKKDHELKPISAMKRARIIRVGMKKRKERGEQVGQKKSK